MMIDVDLVLWQPSYANFPHNHEDYMLGRMIHILHALLTRQLHHSYGNDDSESIPFCHLGVNNEICTHYCRTHDILVCLGPPMQWDTPCARQGGVLRWTKETSQYRRSTSNYGTCKERLMCYMIIMHMSPYDTYGSI